MLGLIIAVVVLPLAVLAQDDPCINYTMLLDDGGRSIKCPLYHPNSHDRFITEGWRRVQLESTREDLSMPTECVPRGYCGSHSTVWLNGTHPTVEDGIVDRMGCLSMFSSCCKVQYPIQIKNCTDFMVYNLKRTLGSDERYCFGDSNLCYQTTSTVRPATKMPRPTIKTPRTTIKTPRPTIKTPRPTTKMPRTITEGSNNVDDNQSGNQKTNNVHGNRVIVSYYNVSDEMVTILGFCLSIAMTILIALVMGIFFYCRQRKSGAQYEVDTKPTKA